MKSYKDVKAIIQQTEKYYLTYNYFNYILKITSSIKIVMYN